MLDANKNMYFADSHSHTLWYAASFQFLNRETVIKEISNVFDEWKITDDGDYYVICDYKNEHYEEYLENAELIYTNSFNFAVFYVR